MLVYVILIACALAAAALIYRYDLYEKEPWYMLLLAAAGGAAASWCCGHCSDWTWRAFCASSDSPVAWCAAIAATHEELAKLTIVVLIALLFRRHFNDPLDGLIYGSFVGLGMALEESIFYMGLVKDDGPLPSTGIVRLLGHLVYGGLDGFAIGMAAQRMRGWPAALLACVAGSMLLHFLWDVVVGGADGEAGPAAWRQVVPAVLMVFGMLVFGLLVTVGASWSQRIFAAGRPRSLWGWPFGS